MTGSARVRSDHSLFAMAFLSAASEAELRAFFIQRCGIPDRLVCRDMHATVYHARRPLGVPDSREAISISVPASELRMMTMAPGGENKRDDIDPRQRPIGLRIRRADGATKALDALRARFYAFENSKLLGGRERSGTRTSAFGARSFQPHVTVLKAGAITDPDLSKMGELIRTHLASITFDRLIVRNRSR